MAKEKGSERAPDDPLPLEMIAECVKVHSRKLRNGNRLQLVFEAPDNHDSKVHAVEFEYHDVKLLMEVHHRKPEQPKLTEGGQPESDHPFSEKK